MSPRPVTFIVTVPLAMLLGVLLLIRAQEPASSTGVMSNRPSAGMISGSSKNAARVTFTATRTDSWLVTCEHSTAVGFEVTHTVTYDVRDTVVADWPNPTRAQPRGHVTGFHLMGFTTTQEDGVIPVVGDPCPSPGFNLGAITLVETPVSTMRLAVNGVPLAS